MAIDTSKYKIYRLFLLEPSAKYRALCTWPHLSSICNDTWDRIVKMEQKHCE